MLPKNAVGIGTASAPSELAAARGSDAGAAFLRPKGRTAVLAKGTEPGTATTSTERLWL